MHLYQLPYILQGYSEMELEAVLAPLRQRALLLPDKGSWAATRAEAFPETRVRQRTPANVPADLLWALRMGAARLFKVQQNLCPKMPRPEPRLQIARRGNWVIKDSTRLNATAGRLLLASAQGSH